MVKFPNLFHHTGNPSVLCGLVFMPPSAPRGLSFPCFWLPRNIILTSVWLTQLSERHTVRSSCPLDASASAFQGHLSLSTYKMLLILIFPKPASVLFPISVTGCNSHMVFQGENLTPSPRALNPGIGPCPLCHLHSHR